MSSKNVTQNISFNNPASTTARTTTTKTTTTRTTTKFQQQQQQEHQLQQLNQKCQVLLLSIIVCWIPSRFQFWMFADLKGSGHYW